MSRENEIAARLDAATPWPWRSQWGAEDETVEDLDVVITSLVETISPRDRVVVGTFAYDGGRLTSCNRSDADLIAHAPEDLRYLLDKVARLEGALRHIAEGGISPALRFAQAVLDGATAQEAHGLARPPSLVDALSD